MLNTVEQGAPPRTGIVPTVCCSSTQFTPIETCY